MKNITQIPFSILDLVPISDQGNIAESLQNMLKLVQLAEHLNFQRFWLAEHHNIDGIASSATAVLIQAALDKTTHIRVGSGGIMLPNHAPLLIAEQFGTLATFHPDRLDLGIGRAPGSDKFTLRALYHSTAGFDDFISRLDELRLYLGKPRANQAVRAIPGENTQVPIWLLGSSDFSAMLAAKLGLPFAFASHFAPSYLFDALRAYREHFIPSKILAKPYVMVAAPLVIAEDDQTANWHASVIQQKFLNLIRGKSIRTLPPTTQLDWSPTEKLQVEKHLGAAIIGGPKTAKSAINALIAATDADELIFTADFYDFNQRCRCFELLAMLKEEP